MTETTPPCQETNQRCQEIQRALSDGKAEHIMEMDVRNLTDVTDVMIICTATSSRHAVTLGQRVTEALLKQNIKALHKYNTMDPEWIVMDYSNVIVHIMQKDTRERYDLEKLWKDIGNQRHDQEN